MLSERGTRKDLFLSRYLLSDNHLDILLPKLSSPAIQHLFRCSSTGETKLLEGSLS
tara:strand:+ start:226 stop:393 length:168 start_codon:yes stop_codon:yes gene_type:complete